VKHTIHVTQEDIDTKPFQDNKDCPIWHALKREFPDADIAVGGFSIAIGEGRAFWFRFEPIGDKAAEVTKC
jgi:hypothetical protein